MTSRLINEELSVVTIVTASGTDPRRYRHKPRRCQTIVNCTPIHSNQFSSTRGKDGERTFKQASRADATYEYYAANVVIMQ